VRVKLTHMPKLTQKYNKLSNVRPIRQS